MINKMMLVLLLGLAPVGLRAQGLPAFPDDPVLRAMQDELARNFDSLRVPDNLRVAESGPARGRSEPSIPERSNPRDSAITPGHPANHPYYLSYTLETFRTYRASAIFGKLSGQGWSSFSQGSVDLRIGDYALDNSPEGRWRYRSGSFNEYLPSRPDYWGVRKAFWLQSDLFFKRAIERYSRKRMLMKTKQRPRPLDDFSREAPFRYFEGTGESDPDTAGLEDLLREVSGLFRRYPQIERSRAEAVLQVGRRYFVSSEGSAHRINERTASVSVEMSGLAGNGLTLRDGFSVEITPPSGRQDVLEKARHEIERFVLQLQAPPMEDYFGPVLFQGQAAAELAAQAVVPLMQAERDPLSEGDLSDDESRGLKKWLNQRVMAPHLTLTDDPSLELWEGDTLAGHYVVDDQGLPGRRITLVDRGILKTFYMSRSPIEGISGSNGHLRGGRLMPGNLLLSTSKGLSHKKLIREMEKLCRETGNDYGIIIKRLEPQRYSFEFASPTIKALEAYRYDLKTKQLVLVRNLILRDISRRTLRDIHRLGEKPQAYNSRIGSGTEGRGYSVITPDILVRQMEAGGPSEVGSLPPLLKNPFFQP